MYYHFSFTEDRFLSPKTVKTQMKCCITRHFIWVFTVCQSTYLEVIRSTWRSGMRSAMRAASQLPGKGPTDVDDAPAP